LRGLLRRGLDGSGFDLSPEMIERAARLDPDHADRYYVADMHDTANAPGGPFHLVFSLGNTISHLSSLEEIGHWIRAVASVLTNGGRIALQFMDVSDLSVGETIDLPQLTSWYGNQTVALDRRYLRDSATTIRFDAVLRGPGNRTVGPISNTLQVVTVDRLKEWMISLGFNELSVIPDGRARTVHATLPGRLQ
ncbi:MAG: class I SAM-dependent methyltransferase, partial [Alkalispirochaeta sp.]